MFKRIVNVVEILALVAAAIFFLLLFINEPGSVGGYASPGAQVFAENCATCHGAQGSGGGTAPALAAGVAKKRFPNVADQVRFVTRGGSGMPAFGGQLSAEKIQQVVDYTRSL